MIILLVIECQQQKTLQIYSPDPEYKNSMSDVIIDMGVQTIDL